MRKVPYPNECPAFLWRGQDGVARIYEGRPWIYDRTGLVDGDIVLSRNDDENNDIIFTARAVIEGVGPTPLTLAARRLVLWVQTWRSMYFGRNEDNEDDEAPYTYDFVDEDGCECRSCRSRPQVPTYSYTTDVIFLTGR